MRRRFHRRRRPPSTTRYLSVRAHMSFSCPTTSSTIRSPWGVCFERERPISALWDHETGSTRSGRGSHAMVDDQLIHRNTIACMRQSDWISVVNRHQRSPSVSLAKYWHVITTGRRIICAIRRDQFTSDQKSLLQLIAERREIYISKQGIKGYRDADRRTPDHHRDRKDPFDRQYTAHALSVRPMRSPDRQRSRPHDGRRHPRDVVYNADLRGADPVDRQRQWPPSRSVRVSSQ